MAAASSNPAFRNSPAFGTGIKPDAIFTPSADELNEQFGRPSATPGDTGRMTYQDTIVKIIVSFAILLVGAAIGWVVPALFLPAAIAGLVLGLVNSFKKQPSRALIIIYAAVEGVFVGGISQFFATAYGQDIVPMAVFGTLGVVAVTLALFSSGKVRASKRATKVFLVAIVGYAAFSLINVILSVTGVVGGDQGLRSAEIGNTGIPWGVVIGIFVVLLAAYSLVLDFDMVKTGVERGAPSIYGWQAAFGIMVTVVWLYVEILRIVALFRD
jgi:uncharacterized YccA/Bax inhibitor family protein